MPTLRQLWSRGQQVILSYEDEASVSRHAELWPGIPYWWGNKVKPQDLVCYLERMKSCGRPGACCRHTCAAGRGLLWGSSEGNAEQRLPVCARTYTNICACMYTPVRGHARAPVYVQMWP